MTDSALAKSSDLFLSPALAVSKRTTQQLFHLSLKMMTVAGDPEQWIVIGNVEDLDSDIKPEDSISVKPGNW